MRSVDRNMCWAILISLDVWRVLIMSYTCKIHRLSSRNIGYKLRASFPNSGIQDRLETRGTVTPPVRGSH